MKIILKQSLILLRKTSLKEIYKIFETIYFWMSLV